LFREFFFEHGRRARPGSDEAHRSQASHLQSAILGLMALILAFTFAMALARFDARRQIMIDEVNAIGTAALRSEILPEPARSEAAVHLRQYVDARLDLFAAGVDTRRTADARRRSERLHGLLWSGGAAIARQDPRSVPAGLYLDALNAVIDLHATRLAAMRAHVPPIVYMLIIIFAISAAALVGFISGLGDRPHRISSALVCALVALVVMVIVDLDQPRRGWIRVSQSSMIDLGDSLRTGEVP